MLLHDLVTTSVAVAAASSRIAKIDHLAALVRRLAPEEVDIAVAFLSGEPRQGRIGLGPAAIWGARPPEAAGTPALRLVDVDEVFASVAAMSGPGSASERVRLLRDLLHRATRDEQDFLVRLLFGELRQGALEAVLLDAVARAAGVPATALRRAVMIAGELAPVARAALIEGEAALSRFMVQIFRPVQPIRQPEARGVQRPTRAARLRNCLSGPELHDTLPLRNRLGDRRMGSRPTKPPDPLQRRTVPRSLSRRDAQSATRPGNTPFQPLIEQQHFPTLLLHS